MERYKQTILFLVRGSETKPTELHSIGRPISTLFVTEIGIVCLYLAPQVNTITNRAISKVGLSFCNQLEDIVHAGEKKRLGFDGEE